MGTDVVNGADYAVRSAHSDDRGIADLNRPHHEFAGHGDFTAARYVHPDLSEDVLALACEEALTEIGRDR